MCVLSIKVPIRKKSGNLFNDPRVYIYIYIYVYPPHHHQVVLPARTSLILPPNLFLLFIAPGRSSKLHPVSAQS